MLKPTPMKLIRFVDDGDAIIISGDASFLQGAEVGDTLLVVNAGKHNWPGKISAKDIWGEEILRLQQALEKSQQDCRTLEQGLFSMGREVINLTAQLKAAMVEA